MLLNFWTNLQLVQIIVFSDITKPFSMLYFMKIFNKNYIFLRTLISQNRNLCKTFFCLCLPLHKPKVLRTFFEIFDLDLSISKFDPWLSVILKFKLWHLTVKLCRIKYFHFLEKINISSVFKSEISISLIIDDNCTKFYWNQIRKSLFRYVLNRL